MKISFLVLFMSSITAASASAGPNEWTSMSGSPSGNLKSMARAANGTLYVGTETGVFRGVANSGGNVTWSSYNGSGSDIGMRSVAALVVSGSNLYAGTNAGVYRGVVAGDGNVTWSSYNGSGSDIGMRSVAALVVSGSNLYAGTNAGVYRGVVAGDGNVTWSSYNGSGSDIGMRSVAALVVSGSNLYAGTNAGVYRGVVAGDGNVTWSAYNGSGSVMGTSSVTALIVSDSTLYAGTDRGVYRGSTGSNTNINWQIQDLGVSSIAQVTALTLSASGGDLYASTRNGVYRGEVRGDTSPLLWTYFTGGFPNSPNVIAMLEGAPNHFYAAVRENGFYTIEMLCGNGTLDHGEICDDGNVAALDGCSHVCLDEFFSFESFSPLPEVVRGETGGVVFSFYDDGRLPSDQEVIFEPVGNLPEGITFNGGRPFSYFINVDPPLPMSIDSSVPLGRKDLTFRARVGSLPAIEESISFIVTDGSGGEIGGMSGSGGVSGSSGVGGGGPNPGVGPGADGSSGGCSCHVVR